LILNLLASSLKSKFSLRDRFSSSAPLMRHHLVEIFEETSRPQPPLLARYLKLDDRVIAYLLGSDQLDARIWQFTRLVMPEVELKGLFLNSDLIGKLQTLASRRISGRGLVYLQGPYGTGKRTIAGAVCRVWSSALLVVDVEHLLSCGDSFLNVALGLLRREALL